jgi:hypothetical protein
MKDREGSNTGGKEFLTPTPTPPQPAYRVGTLLTVRDHEILEALTRHVRVFSLCQVARTWWSDAENPTRAAERRLHQLAGENLLSIERAPAHPELKLEAPIACWNLNAAEPNFGAVSYELQRRWHAHPVLTACVSASRLAADRLGGYGGRPPRSIERTHDIHMAQVYLLYRLRQPELLPDWVFEEQVKVERRLAAGNSNHGNKLPDVLLRTKPKTRAIEFGGAYGKDKLIAFHRYCKEQLLPYEIW